MHTHLYSLPSAVETPEDELDAPVPPIEAVLFDFANTLFRMVPTDVFLQRVWQNAGRDIAQLDIESVLREVQAAGQLPHVQAAQVGRDLTVELHWEATRVWFREVPQLADIFDLVYAAYRWAWSATSCGMCGARSRRRESATRCGRTRCHTR
jgi:hypothetical protein